jgi:hypothetical protein
MAMAKLVVGSELVGVHIVTIALWREWVRQHVCREGGDGAGEAGLVRRAPHTVREPSQ